SIHFWKKHNSDTPKTLLYDSSKKVDLPKVDAPLQFDPPITILLRIRPFALLLIPESDDILQILCGNNKTKYVVLKVHITTTGQDSNICNKNSICCVKIMPQVAE
ncbi:hypothetical protein, partial [Nostoc sp. UHCC 0251]|uniref:hypothetical protein n=1 Tax=Nostoc sp. UHCC 0251 TaxID=3110240 RepID=UPI002B204CED